MRNRRRGVTPVVVVALRCWCTLLLSSDCSARCIAPARPSLPPVDPAPIGGDDARAGPRPSAETLVAVLGGQAGEGIPAAAAPPGCLVPEGVVVSDRPAEGHWLAAWWVGCRGSALSGGGAIRVAVLDVAQGAPRALARAEVQDFDPGARASVESVQIADYDGDGREEALILYRATCSAHGGCGGVGQSARYAAVSSVPPGPSPAWTYELESTPRDAGYARTAAFEWVNSNGDDAPDIEVLVLIEPQDDTFYGLDESPSVARGPWRERSVFVYEQASDGWVRDSVQDVPSPRCESLTFLGALIRLLGTPH